MPARIVQNSEGNNNPKRPSVKTPGINQEAIDQEMAAVLANSGNFSNLERAQFYAGHDRLSLQGDSVQRVRELQEENDHLQREIRAKEAELIECTDPLSILADIEHRKVIISRNTGEILKIYLHNEERMKRIQSLEENNKKIQSEMMDVQGRFVSTKDLEEKTKFASEFFIMKSELERNLLEINNLNQN